MNDDRRPKHRKALGIPRVRSTRASTGAAQPTASKRKQPPRPRVDVHLRPVMSIDETAAYLNLSRETIYAEVRKGKLPVVEFGRRKLVVRALLDEMLITRAKDNWKKEN